MAIDQAQRPQFFEGQYLGAEDLMATVEYSRLLEQRHALGAHTWGIAIGLTLVETPTPDGSGAVTVSISPGYAWDGFGRPIVVLAPHQVPADLFKSLVYDPVQDGNTLPGRSIPLWLQYMEAPAQPPANGFSVCGVSNQNSRVQETFQLLAGDRNPSAQRDPITVSTWVGDAAKALTQFDPQAPALIDASIPHQNFPDDNSTAVWLIPLGCIQWLPNQTAGQPGSFVQTAVQGSDSDQLKAAKKAFQAQNDALRQYIGVVAGAVQAPNKVIRLKDRANSSSLVASHDLVWVEGSLRVDGDANLFGGKIDFKDNAGVDSNLQIQQASNAKGGLELEVVIGNQTAGKNDLAIGTVDNNDNFTGQVVVLDNGNVGIGASGMNARLEVAQSGVTDGIRVSGGTNPLMAATDGTIRAKLQVLTGSSEGLVGTETNHNFGIYTNNAERITVTSAGNVGVATAGLNARLEVGQSGTTDGIRVSGGTNPLMAATDGTIRAKLQVLTANSEGLVGTETSHNFAIYTSNTERVTVTSGGSVGIGTTSPAAVLDIAGKTRLGSNGTITTPLWNVSQPLSTHGVGLPQTANFNTAGGSLLLFVSGSGWSNGGDAVIGAIVLIDGIAQGSAQVFTNESNSHKAFTANAILVRGIAAGTHTVTLTAMPNTSTDLNDFFNVTVLELPF